MSDEKWINGNTGEPYWRTSTLGEDRFVVIHGGQTAPEPVQDAPGRPEAVPVASVAVPEPPVPPTRRQRIVNAVEAVRRGDRSAVDTLRELIGRDPT